MNYCFLCSVPSVKTGDVLCSPLSQYTILEILGCGVFGQVAKCQNISTNTMVAVKILHNAQAIAEAEEEIHRCSTLITRVGGVVVGCYAFSLSVGQNLKESQLPQSPQHLKFL